MQNNQAEKRAIGEKGGGNLPDRLRHCVRLVGSGEELARLSGIPRRTLETYLTGETEPKVGRVVAIARAAQVTVHWLATGEPPVAIAALPGAAARSPSVPVLGLAHCGLKGWYQESALAVSASRPGDLHDPGAFAVIALGASMRPAGILEGFLCFCSPATAADRGDRVFVERRDGTASIKLFVARDEKWITLQGWLEPEDGEPQEPYSEQISIGEVVRLAPIIYVKLKL